MRQFRASRLHTRLVAAALRDGCRCRREFARGWLASEQVKVLLPHEELCISIIKRIGRRIGRIVVRDSDARVVRHLHRAAGNVDDNEIEFAFGFDDREGVAADLRSNGIETRSLYPIPTYRQPIPEYPAVEREFLAAEWACARVLNLPLFFDLCDGEIDEIVACLVDSVERRAQRTD